MASAFEYEDMRSMINTIDVGDMDAEAIEEMEHVLTGQSSIMSNPEYEEEVRRAVQNLVANTPADRVASGAFLTKGALDTFPLDPSIVDIFSPHLIDRPSASKLEDWSAVMSTYATFSRHFDSIQWDAPLWDEPRTKLVIERMMSFSTHYTREALSTGAGKKLRERKHGVQFHSLALMFMRATRFSRPVEEDAVWRAKFCAFVADILPTLFVTYQLEPKPDLQVLIVSLLFQHYDHVSRQGGAAAAAMQTNFCALLKKSPQNAATILSAFNLHLEANFPILDAQDLMSLDSKLDELNNGFKLVNALQSQEPFYTLTHSGQFHKRFCETFAAISRTVRSSVAKMSKASDDRWSLIVAAGVTFGSMLRTSMSLEPVIIPMMFEFGVIHGLQEFDIFITELPGTPGWGKSFKTTAVITYLEFQTNFLISLKPFLLHFSALTPAVNHFMKAPERKGQSEVWTEFIAEVKQMEKERVEFDVGCQICDKNGCPTRRVVTAPTLFRCSGCSMHYYCSSKCQKEDWKVHKDFCKGIKRERLEFSGLSATVSHREVQWLQYFARKTLFTTPAFDRTIAPINLVRHMDLSIYPPVLCLKSLEDAAYNDDDMSVVVGNSFVDHEECSSTVKAARRMAAQNTDRSSPGLMYWIKYAASAPILTLVELDASRLKPVVYKA